jgi:electron transfer flavoprotein beta subunit
VKIGVCVKQVPARDAEFTIREDAAWIEGVESYDTCEPDDYALEAALQLKEQQGGEVVAISLGPQTASEVLKTALAKGADKAIHIVDEDAHALDPFQIASALAGVMGAQSFDLVLTGLQSDDQGFGQTGVILAELLDVPHATVVVELGLDGDRVNVRRELEGGWSQQVSLPLPALLTIQSGINKPRYTTFKGIIAAKRKPTDTVARSEVAGADAPITQQVRKVYVAEHGKQTQLLDGSPAEQAAGLVDKLKNEAHVI